MRTLSTIILFSVVVSMAIVLWTQAHAADKYQRNKPKTSEIVGPQPDDPKASQAPSKKTSDEKVDVSGLEERYWTAKDTEFKVVQNRLYTKEKRFSVTPTVGPLLFDPYTSSWNYGVAVNYYFTERHGVELTAYSTNATESDVTSFFKSTYSTGPDFNFPRGYIGGAYNWVPIYAKLSLLEHKILYFDMGVSPGLGFTMLESVSNVQPSGSKPSTKTQLAPTLAIDLYQQVFLNEHWALRIDFRNHIYPEKVYNANTGDERRSKTTYSGTFMLGVTFYQ
ncbi:MAG: outer membrane beta-barrel domain-containing protein [Oligoflexia bacterium]|nr:outer membrane beta-barrel domain-containing protein [Oligoflexia bacterium]